MSALPRKRYAAENRGSRRTASRNSATASSRRPADCRAWASALWTTASLGNRRTDSRLLLDRGGPVAPVGVGQGDLVADHPVVRLQPPRLGEFGVGLLRLPEREERRPERDVGEGVVGPEPRHLAEDVGGLRGLAAQEERLPEAAQGQPAPGPDARGDGEESDRLLGAARGHQLAPEVGVDPEVVAMRGLGPPEERDRRLSPPEERERGRPGG